MKNIFCLLISALILTSCIEEVPTTTGSGQGVYFIVDTSGSMSEQTTGGRRYEVATKALNSALETLYISKQPDLSVGIMKFSDRTNIVHEIQPYTEQLSFTDYDFAPDSGTAIGDALLAANDDIQKNGNDTSSWNIILITDGENTGGQDPIEVLKHLNKLNRSSKQKVTFRVITLDFSSENQELYKDQVTTIIEANGGNISEVLQTMTLEAIGSSGENDGYNACAVSETQNRLDEEDLRYDTAIGGSKLANRFKDKQTIILREQSDEAKDIVKTIYNSCENTSGEFLNKCLESACLKIVYPDRSKQL